MRLQTKQTSLSPDPVEVFEHVFGQSDYCFLLETPGQTGPSYIGVAPTRRLAARAGRLYVDDRLQTAIDNPYKIMQAGFRIDRRLPPGYVGGLVGYMSHEALRYAEPTLRFPYERAFPDFEFGQYDDGLIFEGGKAPKYFHYGRDRSALYKAEAVPGPPLEIEFRRAAKSEGQYSAMVERARRDIENGRVFQVVLANRYEYDLKGGLLPLYKELRRVNPSPFMFFMKFGDRVTLGASPELLSHVTPAGEARIEALAGTIGRGKTAQEDADLARRLLHDDKEIAEHNMLVDLVRNDIGRVSRLGSVRIEDLMYIKKLSHVQHICSLVSGQLAPGRDAFDALQAAFPAGTLVGTPKIEAAKMIRELESYERGPYGGTVGYFSYNGDAKHAVNIRSVQAAGNRMFIHSGSGIVYDSRAEPELREITAKKEALDQATRRFLSREAA